MLGNRLHLCNELAIPLLVAVLGRSRGPDGGPTATLQRDLLAWLVQALAGFTLPIESVSDARTDFAICHGVFETTLARKGVGRLNRAQAAAGIQGNERVIKKLAWLARRTRRRQARDTKERLTETGEPGPETVAAAAAEAPARKRFAAGEEPGSESV
ncbi:hypothetical protein IFM51744_04686 [Aspergillus udagawae]|uniref:Uncharacterized protein n=1 Tax=Aspergillus udagawae TaxID=91492 RepID=A0ABQ1ANJ6_9EURO|nr:hypothetical protein IFM51744_04686 [Aspergillus udagawae]GFF85000.1 hypothetical protein IFM53868_04336 [Aspergillus udagawae]GFG03411.1 hypothetical protein IFM5058_01415 [Aspergillus udagawae]